MAVHSLEAPIGARRELNMSSAGKEFVVSVSRSRLPVAQKLNARAPEAYLSFLFTLRQ